MDLMDLIGKDVAKIGVLDVKKNCAKNGTLMHCMLCPIENTIIIVARVIVTRTMMI
jgi:hypothetical protein